MPSSFLGMDSTKLLSSLVTIIAIAIYIINKHTKSTFQRYLYTPPTNFRDTFKKAATATGKLPRASVGIKAASMRRRLIMGSKKPLNMSTFPLNSNEDTDNRDSKYFDLRVPQVDRTTEEDCAHFLMNIKPIAPENPERKIIYGFFHPHSYASGGGERVLWEAVEATLENDTRNVCVVYTFADNKKSSVGSILSTVKATFGIDLYDNERVVFVHLNDKLKWMIDSKSWKIASLILQSLSSVWIAFDGLNQLAPDIFIDTQGFPFVYGAVSFCLGIPIVSYVHYPIISGDMLKSLGGVQGLYRYVKYAYWWTMLKAYQISSSHASITLCNSTWTLDNVKAGLGVTGTPHIVYPPCTGTGSNAINEMPVEKLATLKRESTMVYLAQFRPEKRHLLLLDHYAEYVKSTKDAYKLVLIGSTRTAADLAYVETIKAKVEKLDLGAHVKFELNAPTQLVEEYLTSSQVGLNCMWKEHFGISVVEYSLHGSIPLVHASAGPLSDIVVPWDAQRGKPSTNVLPPALERSGLFFKDPSDPDYAVSPGTYPTLADIMREVTAMPESDKIIMRSNAVQVARRKFGPGAFSRQWTFYMTKALEFELQCREARGKVEKVY